MDYKLGGVQTITCKRAFQDSKSIKYQRSSAPPQQREGLGPDHSLGRSSFSWFSHILTYVSLGSQLFLPGWAALYYQHIPTVTRHVLTPDTCSVTVDSPHF